MRFELFTETFRTMMEYQKPLTKNQIPKILTKYAQVINPRMWKGNNFSRVCLFVCPSVRAVT